MVGSIGIVAAVPLTTAIAVLLVDRELPFSRRGDELARGWGAIVRFLNIQY